MPNEKRKRTKGQKITGEFYHNHMHSIKKNFHITHQNCQSKVVTTLSENSTIPGSHQMLPIRIGQHIETQTIFFSKVKYSQKRERPTV